jgi:hypothetical protein
MNIDIELVAKNILLARTIKGYSQEGLAMSVGYPQKRKLKEEKGSYIFLKFSQ